MKTVSVALIAVAACSCGCDRQGSDVSRDQGPTVAEAVAQTKEVLRRADEFLEKVRRRRAKFDALMEQWQFYHQKYATATDEQESRRLAAKRGEVRDQIDWMIAHPSEYAPLGDHASGAAGASE